MDIIISVALPNVALSRPPTAHTNRSQVSSIDPYSMYFDTRRTRIQGISTINRGCVTMRFMSSINHKLLNMVIYTTLVTIKGRTIPVGPV